MNFFFLKLGVTARYVRAFVSGPALRWAVAVESGLTERRGTREKTQMAVGCALQRASRRAQRGLTTTHGRPRLVRAAISRRCWIGRWRRSGESGSGTPRGATADRFGHAHTGPRLVAEPACVIHAYGSIRWDMRPECV